MIMNGLDFQQKSLPTKIHQKLDMMPENWQNNLILKEQNFLFTKNTMQKLKSKIIYPLLCLVLEIKHHTAFLIQKKFLKAC